MHVLIIGAGLSGLSCALDLADKGIHATILEASDGVGGRLRTDVVEGFRLDRGFQVAFTGYPSIAKRIDTSKLDYHVFEAGSEFWDGETRREVSKDRVLQAIGSTYLPFLDKPKILAFSARLAAITDEEVFTLPDRSANQFLRDEGFSEEMIDRFARPFFGGIFLDRSLKVSAQMLCYIWKVLDRGETVIPALGIGEIPKAMAKKLPANSIRLNTRVASLIKKGDRVEGVVLADGSTINADAVILATDSTTSASFTGTTGDPGAKSSTCLYLEAPRSPEPRPILILNGTDSGIVNHVVAMSEVSPFLAPPGRHLVSVTILGQHDKSHEELAVIAKKELKSWFPLGGVSQWRLIKGYTIPYAQMNQAPGFRKDRPTPKSETPGLWLTGEYLEHGSIEGALLAGAETARQVVDAL